MTPKNSIQLDTGKMCFGAPEGCPPLPQMYEVEDIEIEEEAPLPKENPYIKAAEEASLTGTINIETEEAREALRKLTAIVEAALRVFSIMWETIKNAPNRRVIHLAAHGSPRVRKKNVKRLVRHYWRLKR